jgi:glycosyltransferase involved in cell wall biosynthesis
VTGSPAISVVIATRNRAAVLPRAVASVLAQDDADFELIVVDDASTDGTAAYLARLADSRMTVVAANRNLGPSGARNLGIERARAPIVAFLDSDDCYRPRRLSLPLAAFAADPELVCVLTSSCKHDPTKLHDMLIPDVRLAAADFAWGLFAMLIPLEASGITVRRDAALAVGGFRPDLRLTEDREFLIRLAQKGAGQLLPDILWDKYWTDGSLSVDWQSHGPGLVAYVRAQPDYAGRYRRLGGYLAVRVLVHDLRAGLWRAFWRDLRAFHAEGLIAVDPFRLLIHHREVGRYRRSHMSAPALAALRGSPLQWR